MERLMGKTKVEDALERLDMLTQEENLMTVARTFEVAHDIDVNVRATQELTQHVDTTVTVIEEVLQQVLQVDGNIRVIEEGTRSVDDNVTRRGTPSFPSLLCKYRSSDIFDVCYSLTLL
jgi:repressor of nif and glnA expression